MPAHRRQHLLSQTPQLRKTKTEANCKAESKQDSALLFPSIAAALPTFWGICASEYLLNGGAQLPDQQQRIYNTRQSRLHNSHDLLLSLAQRGFRVNDSTLSPEDSLAVLNEAESGNAPAQYIVASVLQYEHFEAQAYEWFERSARQGHKPAAEILQQLRNRAA